MAKTGDGIYKIVEVIGTSTTSWEDAAKKAIETASQSLRDLRIADHAALTEAARRGPCVCLYVYEPELLHSAAVQPPFSLALNSASASSHFPWALLLTALPSAVVIASPPAVRATSAAGMLGWLPPPPPQPTLSATATNAR